MPPALINTTTTFGMPLLSVCFTRPVTFTVSGSFGGRSASVGSEDEGVGFGGASSETVGAVGVGSGEGAAGSGVSTGEGEDASALVGLGEGVAISDGVGELLGVSNGVAVLSGPVSGDFSGVDSAGEGTPSGLAAAVNSLLLVSSIFAAGSFACLTESACSDTGVA